MTAAETLDQADGSVIVAGEFRNTDRVTFRAVDPAANEEIGPNIAEAAKGDVADACAAAADACGPLAALAPGDRADLLEAAGEAILEIGETLIETAMVETGLPRPRLEGERSRTVNQLKLFAAEVRRGEWLDVTIDEALPHRVPPRPDLRRMHVAIGAVAVFGASNFPLAFSVAGGDTASALAAGCPVVVKGHPGHPATGELVARAITRAVARAGQPKGTFSYLPSTRNEIGAALVTDPRISAVGFTGSRRGGLALTRLAAERDVPIPVYAEMSAINPVVILPGALAARAEELGKQFAASVLMGAGQFCTSPGLVVAVASGFLDRFSAVAADALGIDEPQVMLSSGISAAYLHGIGFLATKDSVTALSPARRGDGSNRCIPALFTVDAGAFLADRSLAGEVFGASSLVVRCRDVGELTKVLRQLEGQLTGTIHMDPADAMVAAEVLPILTDRVGRVLVNDWPTGVEVCHAMVHGGPFPATSDVRTTSVGPLAMQRFLRPVCFQNLPDALLPVPLRRNNPWGVPRRVNGRRENM